MASCLSLFPSLDRSVGTSLSFAKLNNSRSRFVRHRILIVRSSTSRVQRPEDVLSSEKRKPNRFSLVTGISVAALAAALLVSEPNMVLTNRFGSVSFSGLALAADPLETCVCLLRECRTELARCLGDLNCAANIACLQSCNGRSDETECQIGCGDIFENSVVDEFNACAVSKSACVPQRADENLFPVPPPSALVPSFSPSQFNGKWYISAGLNPTFDTFDCQIHTFKAMSDTEMTAELTWRVKKLDGGFTTRTAVQVFVQDREQPGLLLNHDNEFLHYQDDWYILSALTDGTPSDYILVYYKGSNDAWDGYGGTVLYTRSSSVPNSIVPEVTDALKKVNLDFSDFIRTDNTCGPEPPLLERLESRVEEAEKEIEREVDEVVRTEFELFSGLTKGFNELLKDEGNFLRENFGTRQSLSPILPSAPSRPLTEEERDILREMERMEMGSPEDIEDLFSNPLPLREIRTVDEQE